MTQENGRLPSSQAFDHLVYLRVFEGCNLHCLHCFIPSNPRRMTLDQIRSLPAQLGPRVPAGSRVLVQWHGGEPTLMGHEFIRQGIEILRDEHSGFDWRHGIQTNLMSYDGDWARLYHDHFGSEVGVSWDPKIRLLNRHAKDSHDRFNLRFEENLRALVADGLTPYVVVTAARTLFETFRNPFDFFRKWVDLGVRHIHIERITETGYARENWQKVGLSNRAYSENMARWARAYALFKRLPENRDFFLSPFENLTESMRSLLAGKPQAQGCWSGSCDTRFHTVDGDGYKTGCTALTSETGNRNAKAAPVIRNDLGKTRELRTYNCSQCPFRPICSSGCLALSFDDGSNECSGGSILFEEIRKLVERDTEGLPA